MLKEASQDETLVKRDLAVAAVTHGRRNPFRSTNRGQSNEPPARQPQFFEYQHGERGRGRGRRVLSDHRGPRGRGGASRRYDSSPLSLSVSSLCNAENVKVGAFVFRKKGMDLDLLSILNHLISSLFTNILKWKTWRRCDIW